LIRLLPLCEPNYNLVELGPRGTGKSYAYQEFSPYVILLTGPTTVANLFYNMATGKMGLVGIWDAIAFDEVADLQKMPKEVVTTLKTYCESGMFARGKDALSGQASLAMFGNTNQPVEVMVRSSHLFVPMPDVIREDMAFLDRIHYYIPVGKSPRCGSSSSRTITGSSWTTWLKPSGNSASTTSRRSLTGITRWVPTSTPVT
jgi:ATP-dependent Lon protease